MVTKEISEIKIDLNKFSTLHFIVFKASSWRESKWVQRRNELQLHLPAKWRDKATANLARIRSMCIEVTPISIRVGLKARFGEEVVSSGLRWQHLCCFVFGKSHAVSGSQEDRFTTEQTRHWNIHTQTTYPWVISSNHTRILIMHLECIWNAWFISHQ